MICDGTLGPNICSIVPAWCNACHAPMTINSGRRAFSISKPPRAKPRHTDTRPPETPKSRRHGAPAGPWPWMDFDHISQDAPDDTPTPDNWRGYPQSLFPNWSRKQVKWSKIYDAVEDRSGEFCVIRGVDIKNSLPFVPCLDDPFNSGDEDKFWKDIQQERPKDVRMRALFLDRPLGPVLQMIGTKYNIEPFFFSSSLNRIPSRYQEENNGKSGDHITITLPFIRIIKNGHGSSTATRISGTRPESALPISNGYLEHELLAIHMIRSPQSSTMISFHPRDLRASAAQHLRTRILDAGYSVYWKNILENTSDPTFVLLIYFWYALYAWDQALEDLYTYISELETTAINNFETSSAQTIHNVHAHLLNYTLLLRDFEESVKFVLNTPNPTLDESVRSQEQKRMERECENLLSEITRLELGRHIHTERLKNAMNLLFSSVNIKDSEQMQLLTGIAVRDSRAMKQVSILTMIFLPASFAASVFGMNVTDFDGDPNIKGTLLHYLETAIPLTAVTVWIIVASQRNAPGTSRHERGWQRLAWPIHFVIDILLLRWLYTSHKDDSNNNGDDDDGETRKNDSRC